MPNGYTDLLFFRNFFCSVNGFYGAAFKIEYIYFFLHYNFIIVYTFAYIFLHKLAPVRSKTCIV